MRGNEFCMKSAAGDAAEDEFRARMCVNGKEEEGMCGWR